MASELYNTIDALSREKGIDPQVVVSAVEDAIVVATRKYYKTQENLRAHLDKDTGKIRARLIPMARSAGNCTFRKKPKEFSAASPRNWRSRSSSRRCAKPSATLCT